MSEISQKNAAVSAEFSRLVDGVTDWDAPTPVKEWQARDIVEHLTSWVPAFLGGLGVEFEPTTAEDDPARAWHQFDQRVQALLEDPDRAAQLVDSPGASNGEQVPVEKVMANFYTADVLMHSWDLAKASGQEANLDPDMVRGMAVGMTSMKDNLAASGQFGTPVELDESHSDLDRLIAIIGRDPQWSPSP